MKIIEQKFINLILSEKENSELILNDLNDNFSGMFKKIFFFIIYFIIGIFRDGFRYLLSYF